VLPKLGVQLYHRQLRGLPQRIANLRPAADQSQAGWRRLETALARDALAREEVPATWAAWAFSPSDMLIIVGIVWATRPEFRKPSPNRC